MVVTYILYKILLLRSTKTGDATTIFSARWNMFLNICFKSENIWVRCAKTHCDPDPGLLASALQSSYAASPTTTPAHPPIDPQEHPQ